MAFYFGINSNSVNNLFSSLGTSSGKNSMTSFLSDYSSIKNGSYGKLLKSYYALQDEDSKKSTTGKLNRDDTLSKILNQNKGTSVSKDSADVLGGVKEAAANLKEAANKLLDKKNADSVYSEENLAKNVKDFVDSYNSVIDAAEDTNTNSINKNLESMINQTKVNQKLLANIGIGVDENNKLTLDEAKLKEADVDSVKSMLGSTGSYGYRVSAGASMINFNAEYEASRANTYTSNGKYSNGYNSGSLYDTLF